MLVVIVFDFLFNVVVFRVPSGNLACHVATLALPHQQPRRPA